MSLTLREKGESTNYPERKLKPILEQSKATRLDTRSTDLNEVRFCFSGTYKLSPHTEYSLIVENQQFQDSINLKVAYDSRSSGD